MKAIIIAHYNENIDWFLNLQTDAKKEIYSKTLKEYNFVPKNKGQEAPCYLKYIIDNYHNLPNKTLFLHAHNNSPHQDHRSLYICQNVNWELSDFFSVNKRIWYQELSRSVEVDKGSYELTARKYWHIFEDKIPFPEKFLFYSGAQFVVDEKLILQYELDFYQRLYEWVQNTEAKNYASSRIFEYSWHYLFTKNPIEKQIDDELLWKPWKK